MVKFLSRLGVEEVETPIGAFNELYRWEGGNDRTMELLHLLCVTSCSGGDWAGVRKASVRLSCLLPCFCTYSL